jgi:hypothetical protein
MTTTATDPMAALRPPYFAMRVLRMATKTALAQHCGTDVLALLTVIACQEDARRYRGPVAFFNAQLLPLLGFRKWERLDRARKAAMDAGWLLYAPPPTGSRQPGLYRTTIPIGAEDLIDGAVDEGSSPEAYPSSGYASDKATPSPYPSNGYGQGYGQGEHSIPSPIPNPEESAPTSSPRSKTSKARTSKPKTTGTFKTQARIVPDELDELIAAWNQLPDSIAPRCSKRSESLVRIWKSATGHADVAAALNDVPKLMSAIRESPFLHGKGWFKFSWLFGKDRSGEWNVIKIVENNYRDTTNAKPKSAARWQGDASDFAHLAAGTPAAAAGSADSELERRVG